MRKITTTAYGIRLPIMQRNDNLINTVVDSLLEACNTHNIILNDKDIVGVTEALVARTEGNYATIDDIANDVREKFTDDTVGVIFPIQSRNRFSIILEGIAKGVKKVILQLSYPTDEVGNRLVSNKAILEKGVNPFSDIFNEKEFREIFGYETKHLFTGLDYIEFYKSIAPNIEIIFSNNPLAILNYTDSVIVASIHTRVEDQDVILNNGGKNVITLADILNKPNDNHGYNERFGVLGSNKATNSEVKLFPRTSETVVQDLNIRLKEATGKNLEVLVYGDGAFKDPVGEIWELADPVSAVAFTDGLKGTPSEMKIKYIADNQFKDLRGKELTDEIVKTLKTTTLDSSNKDLSEGTTPRQISDLVASLCDLTSGSGDKGTPVVLVQGYFDNYSDQ
ncbi:MAG: F420-0--gamma-glutamyl ligase [Erysipelothrix sp.]|nr:F420-0--gamma-glutamyl ligase [Erysipelothrix sp.]